MISVVLVNWNGWADTIACIQSLLNSVAEPARIIVVDNNSTDGSMQAFERWASGQLELVHLDDAMDYLSLSGATRARHVKFGRYVERNGTFQRLDDIEEYPRDTDPMVYIVDSGRNGGFGFGCNVGMRLGEKLGSSAYWLLNNDCVVPMQTLATVAQAVRERPTVIFGTVVHLYHRPEIVQAFGGGTLSRWSGKNILADHEPLPQSLDYIHGASMAFSASCRSAVGDFDERIFMYFEEVDFCLRAATAGFGCDFVKVNVFHKHGSSQGIGSSVGAWMNVLINKHYVLHKHFGWGMWTLIFYTSLILRCLFPVGDKNATIGARRALTALIAKDAP